MNRNLLIPPADQLPGTPPPPVNVPDPRYQMVGLSFCQLDGLKEIAYQVKLSVEDLLNIGADLVWLYWAAQKETLPLPPDLANVRRLRGAKMPKRKPEDLPPWMPHLLAKDCRRESSGGRHLV